MTPRVLCLLANGFEEIETVTPIDLLRRAGAEVVMASLGTDLMVMGRSGIVIVADVHLEDVEQDAFDLLLLPGGPGVAALRADGRAARLASAFAAAGRPLAAICAAPAVLHDAGLLVGRRFTAHFSVRDELLTPAEAERVVIDGDVITSRGAGTALDFGLALVRHLFGADASERIALSIMV